MDTRELEALHIQPESGDPYTGIFLKDGIEIADNIATDDDFAAEMVRRWNAFPELVEALRALVQTIEFQAEANFLNEDADEGEENDLTRARELLNNLKA